MKLKIDLQQFDPGNSSERQVLLTEPPTTNNQLTQFKAKVSDH